MKNIFFLLLIAISNSSHALTTCRDSKVSDFMSEAQYRTGTQAMYCTLAYNSEKNGKHVAAGSMSNQPVYYIDVKKSNPNMGMEWHELIFTHTNDIPAIMIGKTKGIGWSGKLTEAELAERLVHTEATGCFEFGYATQNCSTDQFAKEPVTKFDFRTCVDTEKGTTITGTVKSYNLNYLGISQMYPGSATDNSPYWYSGTPIQINCFTQNK